MEDPGRNTFLSKKSFRREFTFLLYFFFYTSPVFTQPLPYNDQNIPSLFISAKEAPQDLGDDDHIQVLYYFIPESSTDKFFLWLLDPCCDPTSDPVKGNANSHFSYRIYGGTEVGRPMNYNETHSGILLYDTIFGKGKLNHYIFPAMESWKGEHIPPMQGNLFKIVIEGLTGDDGNNYKLFFSSSKEKMIRPAGCKIFFNDLTFMLPEESHKKAQLEISIPYRASGISLSNFDMENCGQILLFSEVREGQKIRPAKNDQYSSALLKIFSEEKGKELILVVIPDPEAIESDKYTSFSWIIENIEGDDITFPFRFP